MNVSISANLARDKHHQAVGEVALRRQATHQQLRAEVSSYTAIWSAIGRNVLLRACSAPPKRSGQPRASSDMVSV